MSSESKHRLEVRKLSVRYGRGPLVLDDVDLTVEGGRITGLLGPNGSGKSTLLHAVTQLIAPVSGDVLLDGEPVSRLMSSSVGFCGDDLPMPELLTGVEYVEMCQDLRGNSLERAQLLAFFEALRIGPAASSLIRTYSHGMKRKVQLIAHVLHSPSLLILDEPFRGLDPETAAILNRLLRSYSELGRVVLVSTHDLRVAKDMCESLIVLAEGEVRNAGSTADFVNSRPDRDFEQNFLEVTGLSSSVADASRDFVELLDQL